MRSGSTTRAAMSTGRAARRSPRCYPSGNGYGYLRLPAGDRLRGRSGRRRLDQRRARRARATPPSGMNVFGSQPAVVWLMATSPDDQPSGGGDAPQTPTPARLVADRRWRRRSSRWSWSGSGAAGGSGRSSCEPLPVRVRAAETVEGHGRLYFRLSARDRAAEPRCAPARARRLSRRVRARATTRSPWAPPSPSGPAATPAGVPQLLFGPPPATDDELARPGQRP